MKKATPPSSTRTRLYRSTTNKMLGGVAGGLGEYFDIDPTIIRIGFILLALLNGIGILIYLVMWILIPTSNQTTLDHDATIKENLTEMTEKAKSFGHSISFKRHQPTDNSRFWWAVFIIAIGFYFLFRNFGLFDALDLGKFWPVILIVAGLIFLLRK
jgi:phage shock protein PspC (stress-responsive transcriptional regulator)